LTDDRADGTRFRIMETIRAYGLERLRECGEETEVRRRHFDWVASLTTQAQPHFDGPGMPVWLERLHLEHDNIRAALSYASTADEQLQLAIDVHRFWFIRGHLTEGRKWLEGALRDGPTSDETRRAKALNSVGILALRKGDTLAARQAFEESMLLRHTSGDKSGAAAALNNLGLVAYQEGDLITARARFEDSVAIYRELGDRAHVGMVLANLGSSLIDQGDLEPAAAASEEFLTIALETRDPWCTATAWHNLAEIALRKGDLVQARELGGKALTKVDELGDSTQLLQLLIMFGEIALAEGSPVRAAELFGSSEAFRLKEGLHLSDREDALFRVAESSLRSQLSDEDFKTAWLRGGEHSRQDFTHLALAAE
jgi:Predicted ATPase